VSSAPSSPLSFTPPRALAALAERYGGTVDPEATALVVDAIAPIATASAGQLAPLLARRHLRVARASSALLLVEAALASLLPAGRRWIHPHASYTLARLLEELAPPPAPDERHLAHLDPGATIDPSASIGAGAVIRAGVVIGAGCRIEPRAILYGGSQLGARVRIGAGAVIGRPGFGWTNSPEGALVHVPQLGGVHIEDDAEVGPLCTVDAGTLGPTVIGRGSKLDAHVHVGHNGQHRRGDDHRGAVRLRGLGRGGERGVRIGGQAGVADHVRIGDGARIAAKSGVIGDVDPGAYRGRVSCDRAGALAAAPRPVLFTISRRATEEAMSLDAQEARTPR
jgi:UDP-3-O-[3-hydroxymyristoyl] glucosamine N-acyltransferase